jgi:hypothetical protein
VFWGHALLLGGQTGSRSLAAVQLVSGGRRCPLEIQAVVKSLEGATSRSNEVPAVSLRLRIEAVTQLASKGRTGLCRERQCVLEDVRRSALHGQILAVRTMRGADEKHSDRYIHLGPPLSNC